jgi:hypothetical protein
VDNVGLHIALFVMSSDKKYDIECIANEMAEDKYGRGFFALSPEFQFRVYQEAEREWSDRKAMRADILRDEQRDR